MSNDHLNTPPKANLEADQNSDMTLADLGWRQFYSQQLEADELETTIPARVVAVHRTGLHVLGTDIDKTIQHYSPDDDDEKATIGDWLLLDLEGNRAIRRLDRLSLFKRKAPGTNRSVQLIAANVDTLMIVSSCNKDFNVARLERYLAVASEAEVTPVMVLTKADQCEAPEDYRRQAEALLPYLCVETVNAKDLAEVEVLLPWCKTGQTIAFVGSSGVGKSTLTNTLMAGAGIATSIATQEVRGDDLKGRHTTTHRELHRLPYGGWVLDTPGIRELQLTDVGQGLADVFRDIEDLSGQCRFRDCQHMTEPKCAVQNAIAAGELDEARLGRWRKLVAENERNSMSVAEARSKDKVFGKTIKEALAQKKR
jgi:ribosome biogenesis GTPase